MVESKSAPSPKTKGLLPLTPDFVSFSKCQQFKTFFSLPLIVPTNKLDSLTNTATILIETYGLTFINTEGQVDRLL